MAALKDQHANERALEQAHAAELIEGLRQENSSLAGILSEARYELNLFKGRQEELTNEHWEHYAETYRNPDHVPLRRTTSGLFEAAHAQNLAHQSEIDQLRGQLASLQSERRAGPEREYSHAEEIKSTEDYAKEFIERLLNFIGNTYERDSIEHITAILKEHDINIEQMEPSTNKYTTFKYELASALGITLSDDVTPGREREKNMEDSIIKELKNRKIITPMKKDYIL